MLQRTRRAHQCSTFTGIYPVFGVILILFRWYWYVVCESGMRVLDSCSGQPLEVPLKRRKEVAVFTSAHSLCKNSPTAAPNISRLLTVSRHEGAPGGLAEATCCVGWKVGFYPGGADRGNVTGPHSVSTLGPRISVSSAGMSDAQWTVVQRRG